MELLRSDVVRYALMAAVFVVLAVVARRAYVWLAGREERRVAEQVRAAIDAGDLRRAGDLQVSRGLFVEASRIFQRAGEHARAAAVFMKLGEEKKAADEYELAEEWARAAPLFRKTGELLKAANCYERSDAKADRVAAAECLNSLKEYLRAGRHYQFAEEFELAADCFSKVEDLDALDVALTMLENAALAKQTDADRKKELWKRAAEMATKLGAHERAARAFDEAGEFRKAARIYEAPLKRFDLAAALYTEAGDSEAAARMANAAGGEATVLSTRLARARARGDKAGAAELETQVGDPVATAPTAPAARDNATNATVKFASGDGPSAGRGPSQNRLDDRFELLGELGRGGMGIVHRAKDLRLGRQVALKFLPPDVESGSTMHRLFLREARAAAALTHAGIVTVYDVGTFGDREFIAMELVEGLTLDRVLEQEGVLAVGEALDIMEKVLVAVEHAHSKSVIHRDLKPANVMRTKDGIKVMDFGLAKVVNSGSSGGQTVVGGTPNYMPPEQRNGNADHRADVFSLGVTFYELLTGVLPGRPGEPPSMSTGYPTPTERVAGVPARLSDLIMRCLEHDRAARPQDVVSVLREVREIRAALDARPAAAPAKAKAIEAPAPKPAEPAIKRRPPVERVAREEEDDPPAPRVESDRAAAPRAPVERVARAEAAAPRAAPAPQQRPLPQRIAREEDDAPPAERVERIERVAQAAKPRTPPDRPAERPAARPARPGQIVEVVDLDSRRGKPR